MSARMAGTEEDGDSAWDVVEGKVALRGGTSADV